MAQKQHILGINTSFAGLKYEGFTEYSFSTPVSYLDYDAVLINADVICYSYDTGSPDTYCGKRLLSESESHRIVQDFDLTKKQIVEMLKIGKNVYVLMGKNEPCYVYTGKREYSGTGKNARATNVVDLLSPYAFLPVKIEPIHVTGENMDLCCKSPYSDFLKKVKKCFYYNSYFSLKNSSPLMKASGTENMIAAVLNYEKGKLVFLPHVFEKEEYRTAAEWKKETSDFLSEVFELNTVLSTNDENEPTPEWLERFYILEEEQEQNTLAAAINAKKALEEKIKEQERKLVEIRKYKKLLTASGLQLEELVKMVLSELGFVLAETKPGRSDVIAQYGDRDIVVEIKGVSKSAAEKHAAQLEKWVSEFYEENEKAPKPLLIVNGYSEIPIWERKESVFPHQMLKYCRAREHALISTAQLLCLYLEIKKNPECASERVSELLDCVGKYERYADLREYLICKEDIQGKTEA